MAGVCSAGWCHLHTRRWLAENINCIHLSSIPPSEGRAWRPEIRGRLADKLAHRQHTGSMHSDTA